MLNFLNILSCFITRLFFLLILQLYESWEVARNVWLLMILIFNMPVLCDQKKKNACVVKFLLTEDYDWLTHMYTLVSILCILSL